LDGIDRGNRSHSQAELVKRKEKCFVIVDRVVNLAMFNMPD